MAGVDMVDDLDHTLLCGTKVKGELVRCQTYLTREHITKECVSVMLIDWETYDVVTLKLLFCYPSREVK